MINSNFGFTPLKEIWLGDCYPESFYNHLPNEVADPFRQITEWTKEDTGKVQKFLESLGIIVRRPVFGQIEDYLNDSGNLVKPPITPRDDYFVLGQTLYSLHPSIGKSDPWQYWFNYYQQKGFDARQPVDQPVNCLSPPSIVRIGRDLVIDRDSHTSCWGFVCEWIVETAKEYRINICSTDGHCDGVFCPIAPGIIASSHYKTDYSQSFPDWEVFPIPSNLNNFNYPKNWLLFDSEINDNQTFAKHIQNLAKDWVGNFNETVYEVNMLVIDNKNVIVMKDYPLLTEWLYQRGINVHVFDLRTRSFWDGGWHCLTLDIHREDTKEDLFPHRGENGVFWRLN